MTQGKTWTEHEAETHRLWLETLARDVPARYASGFEGLRVALPHAAAQIEQCEKWARAFETGKTDRGLFISGPTGTGKTGLAYAVRGVVMVERQARVELYNWTDLLAEIRAGYNDPDAEGEYALVRRCAETALLILDDIGAEKLTEHALGILYQIINRRYSDCLPVVITSNLGGRDLRAAWSDSGNGERIISRLTEMVDRVSLAGAPDVRGKRREVSDAKL